MDKSTETALLDAVGEILRERFAAMERALAAVRVTHVEQVEQGKALLVFGDGSTLTLALPSGAQGERGERGESGGMGERGLFGPPGETGPRGERGPEGAPGNGIRSVTHAVGGESFTLEFDNGASVDVPLLPGPRGEQGERGQDGLDRFICAPRRTRDGDQVAKNELVQYGGGIVQAIRATTRTPDQDPASYVCLVAGVASLRMVENMAARTYDLTVTLTDGSAQTISARGMPRLLAEGPREGERVIKGDQFVKGDWLYTATEDDADPATALPERGGPWKRQNLRAKNGPPGERGEKGERGEPGVGIERVTLDESGILAVRLTSGEEQYVDARALLGAAA